MPINVVKLSAREPEYEVHGMFRMYNQDIYSVDRIDIKCYKARNVRYWVLTNNRDCSTVKRKLNQVTCRAVRQKASHPTFLDL